MQYETASTEIRMRIEDEASLYTYKFTVVGAVLGLLITGLLKSRFENKSPDEQDTQGIRKYVLLDSAVFYWVAAIMAALIDARIQFNAYLMGQLGGWIAMIETSLLANPDVGWEHYIAAATFRTGWHGPFVALDRQLLTLMMFGLALFFGVGHRNLAHENTVSTKMKAYVGKISLCTCMLLYVLSDLVNMPYPRDLLIPTTLALLGIVVAFWKVFR